MRKNLIFILTITIFNFCYPLTTKSVKDSELIEKGGIFYLKKDMSLFSGKVTSSKNRYYFKEGLPHGKWLSFYPNGNLKCIENWNLGKLEGKYILYQKNGLKVLETSYLNGKDNGIYKLYYKNGQLKINGHFSNGIPKGKWEYYDDKGILIGIKRNSIF